MIETVLMNCAHHHQMPLLVVLNLIIILLIPSSSSSASSASSSLSAYCNPREHGVLFVADPTDRQAFLQCRSYGADDPTGGAGIGGAGGIGGLWHRHFCPNDMHFEQDTQQCTANTLPPGIVREANDVFQIAILNGSCARGEHCIGGTVCDQTQQRCLCPYGTVAIVESLSCAKLSPPPQRNGVYQQTYIPNQHQWAGLYGYYGRPYGGGHQSQNQQQQQQQMMTIGGAGPGGFGVGPSSASPWPVPPGPSPPALSSAWPSSFPGRKPQMGGGQQQQQLAKELLGQAAFLKVPLGDRCNEYLGVFCADPSALCLDNSCQCVPPMVELGARCAMPPETAGSGGATLPETDELCAEGQACERGGSASGTTTTTTNTMPKMVQIPSSAESAGPKPPKHRPNSKKAEAAVGEKCSLNADCIAGAYCNGNTQPPTCQCLSTHVSVHNRCEKVIYPGQRGCDSDLQCSAGYAGTRCIGRQCVCPPGSSAIDQTCIPDDQGSGAKNCTSSSTNSSTPCHYHHPPLSSLSQPTRNHQNVVGPGSLCGPLDICVGGSSCVEGICLCPAGTRPSPVNGICETFEQQRMTTTTTGTSAVEEDDKRLGQAAVIDPAPIKTVETHENGHPPPMPTTASVSLLQSEPETANRTTNIGTKKYFSSGSATVVNGMASPAMAPRVERPYARPSESCADGEICTGGSVCQLKVEIKICECPATKPLLRNHICIRSDEPPMIRVREVRLGEACDSETRCTGNSICADDGLCRCRNGHTSASGDQCPVTHKDDVLPPVQLAPLADDPMPPEDDSQNATSSPSSSSPSLSPHRTGRDRPNSSSSDSSQDSTRPRISGPPLRRPSSSSTGPSSSLTDSLYSLLGSAPPAEAAASTSGVCPPGNTPLTDRASGRLVQCNGMTPNCPPKSYCYVTGVASETYNCCKAY